MANLQFDIKIQTSSDEENVGDVDQQTNPYYAYASSWVNFIGNSVGKVGDIVGNIVTFNSYPKEHVDPHQLPTNRTDICDYSGKSEGYVCVQYLPYDNRYGIIHSVFKRSKACDDCYAFCKKFEIYPISAEFLANNGFTGPLFGKSGECKCYRIVSRTSTIVKDGIIIIGITNGSDAPEYVSLKAFCGLNNISYKNMLSLLDDELREFYCIPKTNTFGNLF